MFQFQYPSSEKVIVLSGGTARAGPTPWNYFKISDSAKMWSDWLSYYLLSLSNSKLISFSLTLVFSHYSILFEHISIPCDSSEPRSNTSFKPGLSKLFFRWLKV